MFTDCGSVYIVPLSTRTIPLHLVTRDYWA